MPDHTTFARRGPGLALATALARAQASGPVHVVIDATGLKVHGAGEWLVEKHGERGKRGWRKLHFAVDPSTGEILASELTSNEEGDASQVGPLIGRGLRARTLPAQKTEARAACSVLNRMTKLGMPLSQRIT